MKNLMARKHTFTMVTSRLVIMVFFVALLSAAAFHAALAADAPNLGTAWTFAVLGGTAVILTDSTITGDVGVATGGTVTQTNSTVNGTVYDGDPFFADDAYADFLSAYAALDEDVPCGPYLTGTLANVTLGPGVYCFLAAATVTGVLTLDAQNDPNAVWIFKIGTSGTGALTGTGFSVVMEGGGDPCNVYWWVHDATTLTTSNFQGTILAGADITVTGGSFNGDALAGGLGSTSEPTGAVTLTGANVAGCGSGSPPVPPVEPPFYGSIKVTGGGQISVPYPASKGRATFGFNAQPDKSGGVKGNFNYVNHVTGLHVNGPVTNIVVIAINSGGSPKTVLFSGTYEGGDFIVTVEDNDEPGRTDEFGITVTGALSEVTSQRTISRGNIQFHK